MIENYGLEDPNTNDNIGVFTGEDYGSYFTEKFNLLVERGSNSELDASLCRCFYRGTRYAGYQPVPQGDCRGR